MKRAWSCRLKMVQAHICLPSTGIYIATTLRSSYSMPGTSLEGREQDLERISFFLEFLATREEVGEGAALVKERRAWAARLGAYDVSIKVPCLLIYNKQ